MGVTIAKDHVNEATKLPATEFFTIPLTSLCKAGVCKQKRQSVPVGHLKIYATFCTSPWGLIDSTKTAGSATSSKGSFRILLKGISGYVSVAINFSLNAFVIDKVD